MSKTTNLNLGNQNMSSCVTLRKKSELTQPEVIPLGLNRSCVNGSHVNIAQYFFVVVLPQLTKAMLIFWYVIKGQKIQMPCSITWGPWTSLPPSLSLKNSYEGWDNPL